MCCFEILLNEEVGSRILLISVKTHVEVYLVRVTKKWRLYGFIWMRSLGLRVILSIFFLKKMNF